MSKPSAWRIEEEKWVANSFSGDGARVSGGRWNSIQVNMVYLSEHLGMSVLEKAVHLPHPVPSTLNYYLFKIHFGDAEVATLDSKELPDDWRIHPEPISTKTIGNRWADSKETAILRVPSALLPEEYNYLLNPLHPDFNKIRIEAPRRFTFPDR